MCVNERRFKLSSWVTIKIFFLKYWPFDFFYFSAVLKSPSLFRIGSLLQFLTLILFTYNCYSVSLQTNALSTSGWRSHVGANYRPNGPTSTHADDAGFLHSLVSKTGSRTANVVSSSVTRLQLPRVTDDLTDRSSVRHETKLVPGPTRSLIVCRPLTSDSILYRGKATIHFTIIHALWACSSIRFVRKQLNSRIQAIDLYVTNYICHSSEMRL